MFIQIVDLVLWFNILYNLDFDGDNLQSLREKMI